MSTPSANAIADEYRRMQARLSADAAARVTVAYETLLNPAQLDETFPAYARAVAEIVNGSRAASAVLAGTAYLAYREALRVLDEVPDVAYAGAVAPARLLVSALVSGPVRIKQALAGGVSLPRARAAARSAAARAMQRHVANAGRETVRDTAARDRLAVGYARVTDGDPCAFCAMLAGRGAVYLSADTAGDDDPYHDGCGCIVVPVYSRTAPLPGRGSEYAALWRESTAGYSGRAAIRAFRRGLDAQRRQARSASAADDRAGGAVTGGDALAAVPAGLARRAGAGDVALSRPERAALRDYESSFFIAINGQLRRQDTDALVSRRVAHLDAAMDRSRLRRDVLVWRGLADARRLFGARLDSDLTGIAWGELAYVSTTAAERVARDFASDGGQPAPLLMRIVVPAGTGAVHVSGDFGQSEILLQRGLTLRCVADRGVSPSGYRLIDVVVSA